MSAADRVPKAEPASLRAGLTWQWTRQDLRDYPAPTYTLKYVFRGASAGFNFDASAASDGTFSISVPAATTAGYAPATYTGTAYVDDGAGGKIEVWRGTLTVLPSLASGDARGHVRKVLDAIEAVIEGRASATDLDYEVSVDGSTRRLGRIPHADLIVLHDRYKNLWQQEQAADRLAMGLSSGTKILTRFVRPR